MQNEWEVLNHSLDNIAQQTMIAVKITVSKQFFMELSRYIEFTKSTGSYVNMIRGIPVYVVDDSLAPDYSIDYEYKPLDIFSRRESHVE